jgi:hypothetical protein
VPAGLGTVGVQFEEFGTRVNFLPVVLDSGRVDLEVEVETATVADREAGRAPRRKRMKAELERGQSLVLGGEGWIVLVTPRLVSEEEIEHQIQLEPPGLERLGGMRLADPELAHRIREETLRRTRPGREGLLGEIRWRLLTAGGAF